LGVDVHWNNPGCPQENGVVERSQGTSNRWGEPWTCDTTAELQWRLDRMDRLHRESYPYQKRLSRMAFFPGLAHVSNTFRGHHFYSSEGTSLYVVSFSQVVPGRVAWTPGGSPLCWRASYSHEG
jgi:hypothetical protein